MRNVTAFDDETGTAHQSLMGAKWATRRTVEALEDDLALLEHVPEVRSVVWHFLPSMSPDGELMFGPSPALLDAIAQARAVQPGLEMALHPPAELPPPSSSPSLVGLPADSPEPLDIAPSDVTLVDSIRSGGPGEASPYDWELGIDETVSHLREGAVGHYAVALGDLPGVTGVFHQDRGQILARGDIEARELEAHAHRWWADRLGAKL